MSNKIIDEFTPLPISRQRKYQLRRQRDRRCIECGEPVLAGSRCLKHLVRSRESLRDKRGLRRRYYNTLGYRLALVESLPSLTDQAGKASWSPEAFARDAPRLIRLGF